jgi:hypothetical protein
MRRVRANCARPPFQLETFASIKSESATSNSRRSAFATLQPRSRRRFETDAACCRETPVISLPVSHDPRTRASTQFCKRSPRLACERTALLDAVKNRRSGRPMPISTSDKRNKDRPGPGGMSSAAASIAAFVSATSAPGVPTPRIFPALPFAVAKVRESNQTIEAGLFSERLGQKPHRAPSSVARLISPRMSASGSVPTIVRQRGPAK